METLLEPEFTVLLDDVSSLVEGMSQPAVSSLFKYLGVPGEPLRSHTLVSWDGVVRVSYCDGRAIAAAAF